MGKLDVLAEFETNLTDPGAQKSGEYLQDHIVESAKHALDRGDLNGLIEALKEWLDDRSNPKTLLAVHVIKELGLSELRRDLEQLRVEIEKKLVFRPFYNQWIEAALAELDKADKRKL